MTLLFKTLAVTAIALSSLSAAEEGFRPIFDGKTLNGWTAARSTAAGDIGEFTVNEEEKAIHVYAGKAAGTKQRNNCLNTDIAFSHYILKLEYKWLDNRYAPRADWDRDAGLLFHVHGDTKRVWPFSMEMQIGESSVEKSGSRRFHTGDLFVLGRHLRATTTKTGHTYDPNGKAVVGHGVPTQWGVEKPHGEWNEMEIHVHGAKKATFIFNGEVVHEITDMKLVAEDGEQTPLDKGRIGLQAEWAEILYRNIRIKELPSEQ